MGKSPAIRPNRIHRPWQRPQRQYYPAVLRREYAGAATILAARWKLAPPTDALNTMTRLLDPGSEPSFRPRYPTGRQQRGTNAWHLWRELSRLKRAGITPWAALLTFCAVFVRVWSDPRKIGDGIGLTAAAAREVFKLTRTGQHGRRWDAKRGRMVDRTNGYIPRSAWRSWGTQARTELRAFLMESFEFVAAHPCRKILEVNRKEDVTAEQARIRRDRRERKALDHALNLPPTASGRRNSVQVAAMNRARKDQQMTALARREKYTAPPGTSDVPVPWDFDGSEPMDAPPQQPSTSAHVQGATIAPRPNYTGITPAIAAQFAEQEREALEDAQEKADNAAEYEPTHDEMVTVAKELKADLNYPLGRAKVIGTIRERRR